MIETDATNGPAKDLTTSRSRFIAELPDRISMLRQGLARLASGEAPAELNAVRRRLHAVSAAAEVLHFMDAARALAVAQAALGATGTTLSGAARDRVTRILDLLPSLVLGAPLDVGEELEAGGARVARQPLSVLVYGDGALEALLQKPGPLHAAETHATRDPERALELCATSSPDILLLDGDDAGAPELVPRLRQALGTRDVPMVAVGSFDRTEPLVRLVRRGVARVQPKPIDAAALQRSLLQAASREVATIPRPGSFQRLTPDDLVHAVANEARRAFVLSASGSRSPAVIDFGSGSEVLAALWAAFARIRALATEVTEGGVQFSIDGPAGALPLAPAPVRPGSAAMRELDAASLAGRTFVIADDDPDVLGLLARALEHLGARVLWARNGREALDLAERHSPDAMLSDTAMPELDGFELCRRVREDIALADLPIGLVCWKDHLLERARRNDGNTPELDAASLAPDLVDLLAARSELEHRLASGAEIHGRLDGFTPRLLLELTCRYAVDARLGIRSSAAVLEVDVVSGRPRHARAVQGDSVVEGEAALGALLGARSGRFTVQRGTPERAAHFEGDLEAVLGPVIERARRVRARLVQGGLNGIERAVIDPLAAAQYLADSGATNRAFVAELLDGTPLRLLATGRRGELSEAPRLTALLIDLARRGAVTALVDKQGRDVTSDAPTANGAELPAPETPPPPRSVVALGEAVLHAVSSPPMALPPVEPLTPSEPRSRDDAEPPPAWEPAASDAEPRESLAPARPALPEGAARTTEAAEREATWPPPKPPRRGRAAAVLIVAAAAAALAFFALRPLARRAPDTAPSALTPAPPSFSREAPGTSSAAGPTRAGEGPAVSSGTGPDARSVDAAPDSTKAAALDARFETGLSSLPPHTRLSPGHGLLEVRTWQPQRIYVDGVFMGNHASRLIPLSPGTHQLRLEDGGASAERSVEVQAGQMTRLIATPRARE